MSQWTYVIIAYGLAALATIGLVAAAFWSMRGAESDVETIKHRP